LMAMVALAYQEKTAKPPPIGRAYIRQNITNRRITSCL
jgi:hypothetical protein